MINDFVYYEMLDIRADGVDFLSFFCRNEVPLSIIKSFIKKNG